MDQSAQQLIENILRSLEARGAAAAPVLEATALATSHPEAISDLALAVMHRFPRGGTFLDGALSYLPQEQWPELVEIALTTLEQAAGKNGAAESVIEYASFQCLSALHPHLDRIFLIRPNAGTYYEAYPWRESGDQHSDFLKNVLRNSASDDKARARAWRAVCETRNVKLIEDALTLVEQADVAPAGWSRNDWVVACLHLVGYKREEHRVKRICSDELYHLQFPEDFLETRPRPPWLARIHPTWNLPSITQVPLGGSSNSVCSLCGEKLHKLIALDPVPTGLGITRLARVEFATCLSCLGWERQQLFYRHDEDGYPKSIAYDGPRVTPRFPVGPLMQAEIGLAKTPPRWFWESWGCSNSRENLNRVGGEPCWIQSAEYPNCPSCKRLMSFVFQLDSDLPTADGDEWMWGSGGIAYGFWCDSCGISGFLWQCT